MIKLKPLVSWNTVFCFSHTSDSSTSVLIDINNFFLLLTLQIVWSPTFKMLMKKLQRYHVISTHCTSGYIWWVKVRNCSTKNIQSNSNSHSIHQHVESSSGDRQAHTDCPLLLQGFRSCLPPPLLHTSGWKKRFRCLSLFAVLESSACPKAKSDSLNSSNVVTQLHLWWSKWGCSIRQYYLSEIPLMQPLNII